MGTLHQMGRIGDTQVHWDPTNPQEVETAKKAFDALFGKGFLAFKLNDDGSQGEQIRAFDSTAAKIILSPPMAGG